MTAQTLSDTLAEFAAGASFSSLPPPVVASACNRVLDTLGLCIAATGSPEARAVAGVARALGGTAGDATAIGAPERLPATAAALVNGSLAHSLEFDDTHLPSILHPSAVLVPATLAAAEQAGSSGAELVTALAVGYEIDVRLGMAAYDAALRNNVFFERGLHATSICGALAASAAAAKLLRLDAARTRDAIGIAASMGAGLLEANRTGGSVKRLHCGLAAEAGLKAAAFAAAGLTAPPTVLEGRFGFYEAFAGGAFDPAVVVGELGTTWQTPLIHVKPYPANHFTHAGIDAALRARAVPGFAVSEVTRVEVGVAAPTLRTIAEPREQKVRPLSGYAAKFSGPYTVAAALVRGHCGYATFEDAAVGDPEVLALAERVFHHPDPRCDSIYPEQFPATMSVHRRDGDPIVVDVLVNHGSPQDPLSASELEAKFTTSCARGGVAAGDAAGLMAAVRDLAGSDLTLLRARLGEISRSIADAVTRKEVLV